MSEDKEDTAAMSVNYEEVQKRQEALIMDLHSQNKQSMDRMIYLEGVLRLLLKL